MGETVNLVIEKPPKKLEYLNKLAKYDQKNVTLFDKAKKFLSRKDKTRPHSISEWCKILGSTDTNPNTRKFLEELVEHGALQEEDTKGEPPNDYTIYSLNRDKLVETYYNSLLYNLTRDLNFDAINKKESGMKIRSDI